MLWKLFIVISITFTATATLIERVILKESESQPIAYAILFEFIIGLLFIVLTLITGRFALPKLQPLLGNILLMIILYSISSVATFFALKEIEIGKYIIIFSLRSLFTLLGGTLWLHQGLSLIAFVGLLCILGGIFIVSLTQNKISMTKGDIFALIAGASFGLANVNDKFLLHSFNVLTYLSIGFIGPAVLLALIFPKEIAHMKVFFTTKVFIKMTFLCIIYAISILFFFIAIQSGPNVSLVVSLSLLSVLLTVIFGIVFLKERSELGKKLLGSMLSIIGLLLIG
jgi:drug/metabolite transporter (DMT)-like permease